MRLREKDFSITIEPNGGEETTLNSAHEVWD